MNSLPSGHCLHDLIMNELFRMKSLAALIYLINAGRELEFYYKRIEFFITSDNNEANVVLYQGKIESKYNTMDELINNAILVDTPFIEAWTEVELGTLF